MPLGGMFTFEHPEERRRRTRDFQKKIFPLGMEQRELALSALRPLIDLKVIDTELLYVFITVKEKFVEYDGQEAVDFLKKHHQFSETEKSYIMALVVLDSGAVSLEEYPTASDIKDAVK